MDKKTNEAAQEVYAQLKKTVPPGEMLPFCRKLYFIAKLDEVGLVDENIIDFLAAANVFKRNSHVLWDIDKRFKTVKKLATCDVRYLKGIRGVGPKTVKKIYDALIAGGYTPTWD